LSRKANACFLPADDVRVIEVQLETNPSSSERTCQAMAWKNRRIQSFARYICDIAFPINNPRLPELLRYVKSTESGLLNTEV
jgi:hypothetical protein